MILKKINAKYVIFISGFILGTILTLTFFQLAECVIPGETGASNLPATLEREETVSNLPKHPIDPGDNLATNPSEMKRAVDKMKRRLEISNSFLTALWNGLIPEDDLIPAFDQHDRLSLDTQVYNALTDLNLPRFAIENVFKHLVDVDPSDIPPDVPIEEFAARLVEVAAADLVAPRSDRDAPDVANMTFDVMVDTDNTSSYPRESFSVDDNKIYASFETGDYPENSIIIKWSDMENREIVLFRKLPIDSGMATNFVYLERENGWTPGRYRVEIYGLTSQLPLLSSGEYTIDP